MMRILICGSNGMLGQRLSAQLSSRTEFEVLNTSVERAFVFDDRPYDFAQLDITHRSDVRSLVGSFQPTVIINAAAATNVDWCETNREEAWKINVTGVENLAESARRTGAHLIHISTDYVFDGRIGPYDEDAQPNPLSYYGKTKLASENAIRTAAVLHTVIRTIVMFGTGVRLKSSFPVWVVNSLREQTRIRVVDDQWGNPTHVADVTNAIIRCAERRLSGTYHVAGSESMNRFDFAKRIAEVFQVDGSLIDRIKTADLNQPAPRPLMSGLITRKAEAALGMRFMNATEGLMLLKHELQQYSRN
jgi:dTDP-4-dehydrorhamnose reductase